MIGPVRDDRRRHDRRGLPRRAVRLPAARLHAGHEARRSGASSSSRTPSSASGAKVPHLSYVGDADVGAGSNLGASTITANYDGHAQAPHDDRRRASSTSMHSTLVAPVTIGDGAYVAAGSVITEDVEPGALAIARPRQTTKPGYAERVEARRKEERALIARQPVRRQPSSFPRATTAERCRRAAQQLPRRHLVPADDAVRRALEHRPGRAHRRRARRRRSASRRSRRSRTPRSTCASTSRCAAPTSS